MLPHLLHLVQRPSGMSRLRDLDPASLGFLTNVVCVSDPGGASTASKVSAFLLKVVVAMFKELSASGSSTRVTAVPIFKRLKGVVVKPPAPASRHRCQPRRLGARRGRTRWWWRPWSGHRQ